MKGRRISYTEQELAWIRLNSGRARRDMAEDFARLFGRDDVTAEHMKALCIRKGWSVGPAGRARNRGKSLIFTPEQVTWLKEHAALSRQNVLAEFAAAFPDADITLGQIVAFRKRNGIRTGRSGRFDKGHEPWSKGRKMPWNANRARTQFKKGDRGGVALEQYKPIGTERKSREGYIERKIHDGMPLQSRWRALHLIRWEQANGAVPDGMCLKCLDGDKTNTDPANWELIPRAMLPRLNGRFGRGYDDAPQKLKPLIMTTAKLEHRAREAKKRESRHERS